jgi:hypothetical protein
MYKVIVTSTFNITKAINYLKAQYNPAIGLFREAPNAAPNNYWYYNDLLAAQLALGGMPTGAVDIQWPNFPPPRVRVLNGNVFKDGTVLAPDYIITLNTTPQLILPLTRYQLHEMLKLNPPTTPLIMTETPNLSAQPYSVTSYADIAFYNVIHLFNQGLLSKARQALVQAERIWDGYGWKDQGFYQYNKYETYKCALYLIACNRLGLTGAYTIQNQNVINRAQVINRSGYANQEGGVSTHYLPGSYWEGDTNVETTSKCAYAWLLYLLKWYYIMQWSISYV